MKKQDTIHVIPDKGKWRVVKPNSKKAIGVFENKNIAEERALNVERNSKGRVIIHNKDGRINEVKDYAKIKSK